jgi:hypothetical protein
MSDSVNFIPDFLMSIDWYDGQTLVRVNHIIFLNKKEYMILIDDSKKILDVSKMPNYIQEDYIKHKSTFVSEEQINILIRKLEWWCGFGNDETQGQIPSDIKYEEYMSKIQLLKNIKRDLKIKRLLS